MVFGWSTYGDDPPESPYQGSQQQYKPRQYADDYIPRRLDGEIKINSTSESSGMRRDRIRAALQKEAAITALKPAHKYSSRSAYSPRQRKRSVPAPHADAYSYSHNSLNRESVSSTQQTPRSDIHFDRQISSQSQRRAFPTRQSPIPPRSYSYLSPQSPPYPRQRSTTRQISPVCHKSPLQHGPRSRIDSVSRHGYDDKYDDVAEHRRLDTSHMTPRATPSNYAASPLNTAPVYYTPRHIQGYLTPRETPASGYQHQQSQARTALDRGRRNSIAQKSAAESAKTASHGWRNSSPPLTPDTSAAFQVRDHGRSSLHPPRFDASRKVGYIIQKNNYKSRGRSPVRRRGTSRTIPTSSIEEALGESEKESNSLGVSETTHASTISKPTTNDAKSQENLPNLKRRLTDKTLKYSHQIPARESAAVASQVFEAINDSSHSARSSSPEENPIPKSIPLKHRFTPQGRLPTKTIKSATTFTSVPNSSKPRLEDSATPLTSLKAKSRATPRTSGSQKRVKFTDEPADQQQPPLTPPEQQRQLAAAATIISREAAFQDIQLFGEVVETDLERANRLAKEQLALETTLKAKEAKETKAAAKEETKANREREKSRLAAERAEFEKQQKELQEAKKKTLRERQRRKSDIKEQRELELKRQLVVQQIEYSRLTAEMSNIQKEITSKEKAGMIQGGVQVDMAEMSKLHAKKDRAKKEAAGLTAGKRSDPPKENESALFVVDNRGVAYETRSRAPTATASLPAPIAQTYEEVKASLSARDEAEKLEAKQKKDAAKRLKAHGEKMQAKAANMEKFRAAVAPKSMKSLTSSTPKTSKPTNPVQKKVAKNPFQVDEEDDEEIDNSMEMGGLIIEYPGGTAPSGVNDEEEDDDSGSEGVATASTKASTPSTSPSKTPAKKTVPKTIAKNSSATKAKKTQSDSHQANLKKSRDKKARNEARDKFIAEAEAQGTNLTNSDLDNMVARHMAVREKRLAARKATYVKKRARQQETLDSSAMISGAPTAAANAVATMIDNTTASNVFADPDEVEDALNDSVFFEKLGRVTPEVAAANARREARKQKSIKMGSGFSKLAEERTVKDLVDHSYDRNQSYDSEESNKDEDEDDLYLATPTKGSKRDAVAAQANGVDEDMDEVMSDSTDDEADLDQLLNDALDEEMMTPLEHSSPTESQTLQYGGIILPQSETLPPHEHQARLESGDNAEVAPKETEQDLYPTPKSSPIESTQLSYRSSYQQVHVYTVKENTFLDNVLRKENIVGTFVSCDQANAVAATTSKVYRTKYGRYVDTFDESYDQAEECYNGNIQYTKGENNYVVQILVERHIRDTEVLEDYDELDLQLRKSPMAYICAVKITKKYKDPRTGDTIIESNKRVVPGFSYSNYVDANFHAGAYAIKFLKPKVDKLTFVEGHCQLSKHIRTYRDAITHDKGLMTLEIDMHEQSEKYTWLRELGDVVEFSVEKFAMRGPLN